jgi:N-acetylneuraminic acid mutarotase
MATSASHGYLGGGLSADNSSRLMLYDFYKYDPQTNSWSTIPNYPDNSLNFYVGHAITVNNRPFYSLSNQVSNMRELINDTWISKPAIPDMNDSPGSGIFSIGKKIYLIVGYKTNWIISHSVWEFDSENETWTQKSDFPGPARNTTVAFSIGKYGYFGTGSDPYNNQFKDFWRYDPSRDKWIRLDDFPGGPRSHTISISDGKAGFAGLGILLSSVSYYKDFWKFEP